MKKYFKYVALSLLVAGVSSCAKEEIGGTAVQEMCGEWIVEVDGVDADGNVVFEAPFGSGFTLYTFNTNANVDTEMYLYDDSFWGYQIIANVNYAARTFNADSVIIYYEEDEDTGEEYPVHANFWNGKIVKDGTKSPAGYTADSISFEVSFEDDPYPAAYGYDHYLFHGYRRTGLNGGYD